MALFICPNCEDRSEIEEGKNGKSEMPYLCPHCGVEFKIDQDLNLILDEKIVSD